MAIYYIDQAHFDNLAFVAAAMWWDMEQDDTELEKFILSFCTKRMIMKDDLLILSQFYEVVPGAVKAFMKLSSSDVVLKRAQVYDALAAAANFAKDHDSYGKRHKGFLGLSKLRGGWFIKSHPHPQERVAVFYESFPRYIQLGLTKLLISVTS